MCRTKDSRKSWPANRKIGRFDFTTHRSIAEVDAEAVANGRKVGEVNRTRVSRGDRKGK